MDLIEKGDDASPNPNPTKGLSNSRQDTTRDGDNQYDEGDNEDDFAFEGEGRSVDKTVKDPLNFSHADTALNITALEEKFPRYSEARKATVDIVSGDMLYLPASWVRFHEVTSYGSVSGFRRGGITWLSITGFILQADKLRTAICKFFLAKNWALRKF